MLLPKFPEEQYKYHHSEEKLNIYKYTAILNSSKSTWKISNSSVVVVIPMRYFQADSSHSESHKPVVNVKKYIK